MVYDKLLACRRQAESLPYTNQRGPIDTRGVQASRWIARASNRQRHPTL